MSSIQTALRASSVLRKAPPQTRTIVGTVQSILHGSPQAKAEGELENQQHSKLVGRGKYIHSFEVHRVKPDKLDEYKEAASKFYAGVAKDENLHVKLTGCWEITVGPQDTFVHILEYENFQGYDKSVQLIQSSDHAKAYKGILPYIQTRNSQLCQEFAFLPSSPPRTQGGLFELRTYTLHPGKLLEWEHAWRGGIEARKETVSPVGAWFSQCGKLHQVHHLWQYASMAERKQLREKAWQTQGWSETVSKTGEYAMEMNSTIMLPLPYSPLK